MRAVILGNGTITDYDYTKKLIHDGDFIICADGGANHLEKLGISANVLVGDFDSVEKKVKDAAEIIQYPTRKDFTDGELCMDYAVENGFQDVLLLGMSGTRLDHTINNILLLFRCKNGCLVNEYCEIYALTDELCIDGKKGKTLSIIPMNGDLEGITTYGLDYPLDNGTLYFGEARGNSNVINEDSARITVKKGKGIVIISNGE